MAASENPLLSDRDVDFLLYEVLNAPALCRMPYFADHSRETFDLYLSSARRLAREALLPAYKPSDEAPPVFRDGRVSVHPRMHELFRKQAELGVIAATRPVDVGGQQLPQTIASLAMAYLMAGNTGAFGFLGLTTGAAHLIEAFGSPALREQYMSKMYSGEWTGTMALTEPQAGSSLSDVKTRARPTADGHYLIEGTKIFISGGDQDITENIVHLALARIEWAPAGIKGVSLFVVPKRRVEGGRLVGNDVSVAGLIHKIGCKALPSAVLNFGESGDCRGWLVGEPHRGISYMFQMMNEARIAVGINGVATAAVAYHQAIEYARTRPQGRPATQKDPAAPQVAIIEHSDVRRMLLRQKAIVEGGMSLVVQTAYFADVAEHGTSDDERRRARLLLDLLTPLAKTFPAEKGFESNALAVQVHGGYGYSSEYLPESWLRDQKLNSLHEGTTGIQGMDLLGRKVVAEGGAALRALYEEIGGAVRRAKEAGVEPSWCDALRAALDHTVELTMQLGAAGAQGDVDAMMRHSTDYLDLFSTLVVSWQWLLHATAAKRALAAEGARDPGFYEAKLCAAQYWLKTELPRIAVLAELCRSGEDSYARMRPEWF